MATSFIKKVLINLDKSNVSVGFKKLLVEYQIKCDGLSLDYVPGVIRHYFHGSRSNKKYSGKEKHNKVY